MTPKKPVWFLDVDGVINAVTFAAPENYDSGVAEIPGTGERYTMHWNPRVIEEINRVSDEGLLEVVWLTTWGEEANNVLTDLMGVNKFPVYAAPPSDFVGLSSRDGDWWKLKAIQERYIEDEHRRHVWTDDELALERVARQWCSNKRIYTISPRPHVGLTMNDIQNAVIYANPRRAD